jgi:hypothetical protein
VLERLDGGPGAVAEDPIGVDQRGTTTQDRRQATLDIGNGFPLVTEGGRQAYRYAEISWSSWPLGLAPIRRTSG